MSALTNAELTDAVILLQQSVIDYNEAISTVWLLLTGYLVWFMSAGFAFLELGGVRQKNSQNILVKNMLVPVLTFMSWYVVGFGLAFGAPGGAVPGGLSPTPTPVPGAPTPSRFCGVWYYAMSGFMKNPYWFKIWFFQGAFADTTASIVSGGIAERMSLLGFMAHAVLMTGIIYPICVYWTWSGSGWLSYLDPVSNTMISTLNGPGYKDWAGSGVIHYVGGVAALCGAIIVGPRKGRFDPNVSEEEFAPHSVPFTVLGTFVLWLGWYGFNPGCTSALNTSFNAGNAALTVCNTTLAPCAAGLTAFFLKATIFPPRRLDVPGLCNGILAGLVGITAASGFVEPWEAILIGIIAGILYCISAWVIPMLKIDDPIEAISVHMVNGAWGAFAIGFFGNPKSGYGGNGVFYGGNQLGIQALAIFCFTIWSAGMSCAIWIPLRMAGLLRWSDEFQDVGADEMQHSPRASYRASGTGQLTQSDKIDNEKEPTVVVQC